MPSLSSLQATCQQFLDCTEPLPLADEIEAYLQDELTLLNQRNAIMDAVCTILHQTEDMIDEANFEDFMNITLAEAGQDHILNALEHDRIDKYTRELDRRKILNSTDRDTLELLLSQRAKTRLILMRLEHPVIARAFDTQD